MEPSFLEKTRSRLQELIRINGLEETEVTVLVKTLTPQEAIGEPGRRDFPILQGKERMIEATVLGAKAQAFTDAPAEFIGPLKAITELPLLSNRERALYTGTLNAVLKYLKRVDQTLHCRDEDPERCAQEMAAHLLKAWGRKRVGLIGLNPAMAENLVKTLGKDQLRITDLNPENIGSLKFGVEIWDGNRRAEELIRESEGVLISGTTFVNGTFDLLWEYLRKHRKKYWIYGVTAAGVCELLGLKRICPYGNN